MRTFIALGIPLNPSSIELLNNLKQKLCHERIRWVNFESLHLTLFFLGEADEAQINKIDSVFKTHISPFAPLGISLKGVGTFGQKHNPKVLWLGVEPSETLRELHAKVNEMVSPIGFVSDKRGFNPHITIGRIKTINNIQLIESVIEEADNQVIHSLVADKITLYKSTSTPNGPIYTPLIEQQFMGRV
ncbi:MAG: RNA 2',3'-cyclic phosphodiesterase [Bacteroidales bacterium]|nr:RNA 2',3'-cyclic phosphodiesterase [Bacteroidales bacterium]MDD3893219.1 RNA 2',3'-cyclic phosphodiesterase [Bacteroidales bacterium]